MTVSREQTRQNYDRLSRWYDLFTAGEKKFTESGLQILDIQAGEYVLEVGFGTGHSLVEIGTKVGNSGLVAGVEVSPGMIAVAQKRMQGKEMEDCAQILRGDGAWLPFVPNSFDAVFLSFTLELFSDSEITVVLNECDRVLKPEGRLGVVYLAKRDNLACRLYEWGHERWPALLDCKPIHLKEEMEAGGFYIQSSKLMTMWGLPVEIVLGRPLN